MPHLHLDVADPKNVAVVQLLVAEVVAPLGAALAGQQQLRPGRGGEFAAAREVVGVDVGLGDVGHAQAL